MPASGHVSSIRQAGFYSKEKVADSATVAQHFMLMEALKSGVAEERIAATLNVDVAAIRRRARMLEGICSEVVEMLRDKKLSLELFPVLRKMKAIGQITIGYCLRTASLAMRRSNTPPGFEYS